jgi:hypothetical protein
MGQQQSLSLLNFANSEQSPRFSRFKTHPGDSVILTRKETYTVPVKVKRVVVTPNGSINGDVADRSTSISSTDSRIRAASSEKIAPPKHGWSPSTAFSPKSFERKSLVPKPDFSPQKLFPKTLWEGQLLCEQNEAVREAFVSFVLEKRWILELSQRYTEILGRKLSAQEAAEYILFNDYLVHPRNKTTSPDAKEREVAAAKMMKCTHLKVQESLSTDTLRRPSAAVGCFPADQMLGVILASLWPLFQSSAAYAALNVGVGGTSQESSAAVKAEPGSTSISVNRSSDTDCLRRVRDVFVQTINNTTAAQIESILLLGKWVESVLNSVENLNIPIFVAAVDSKTNDYPTIFVNRAFEELKKCPRQDLLGKNCRLLKSSSSNDADSLTKINVCLSRGLGLKIVLQNNRRDSSEFTNLLSLRPVHDWQGDYKHVIGVSCDATRENACLKDIRMAHDFQTIFCGILRG